MSASSFLLRMIIFLKKKLKASPEKAYQVAYTHMFTEQINPLIAWDMQKKGVMVPVSLNAAMINRHEHMGGLHHPEMIIDNKITGRRFAHLLGFNLPKRLTESIPLEKIRILANSVIKPVNAYSAHGVFVVKSDDHIIELRTGRVIRGRKELVEHMYDLLENRMVPANEWTVEECILREDGNLANDIKFYVFYGKFAWFSEIQRYPESKHYMLDHNGEWVDYGLYPKHTFFKGRGVTKEEIRMVEQVSLKIPAPFIRIDFLRGKDGLYFGEFTPRSGVIGYLPVAMDKRFGRYYYEASSRLLKDLLRGKQFASFQKLEEDVAE